MLINALKTQLMHKNVQTNPEKSQKFTQHSCCSMLTREKKFLSHLGQAWVYPSHKPELLTTSMMVFGRERPTFGDEMIFVASYCFQKISRVNIEQQEGCVNFCDFLGFVWAFLCINRVFNALMCIIQI